MKKLLIFSVLVLMSVNIIYAQEYREGRGNYSMGFGPMVAYKLGINAADPPQGIKNGVGTAGMPDLGISYYLPLNPDDKMGLFVDAAYASYAYIQKFDGSSTDWTDRFTYLAFGPNFYISGFTIGLNIGIPLSGERVFSDRTMEIQSSTLATMFEFKVGGHFTLNESELGRLNLFLNGSYQINGQYTDDLNLGAINYHPASLQVGLSYIFNMN
jgi:hypothetical protein